MLLSGFCSLAARTPTLSAARFLATGVPPKQPGDHITQLHEELSKKLPASYNPGREGEISKVLFTISNHFGISDQVSSDFKQLAELLGAYPKIKDLLFRLEPDALPKVLVESLKVHPETASMIRWIATEQALHKFDRIVASFSDLIIQETGQLTARIDVGVVDKEWIDFLKQHLNAGYPGRKLQIEVRHDPSLGPACRYQVGDQVHDDSILPKFTRLSDEAFSRNVGRFEAEKSKLKHLKLQLAPNDEQKFWRSMFNPNNINYDWTVLKTAVGSDGRVDWTKLPKPQY